MSSIGSQLDLRPTPSESRVNQPKMHNKAVSDRRNKASMLSPFEPGDLVKMKGHNRPNVQGAGAKKIRKKWSGPYRVIQRRQNNFLINQNGKARWVNGQRLTRWYTRRRTLEGGTSEGGLDRTRSSVRIQTSKRCGPSDADRCVPKPGQDRTGSGVSRNQDQTEPGRCSQNGKPGRWERGVRGRACTVP